MKTYILQKDLPDIKAGAGGLVNKNGLLCFYENESAGEPEYFFPKETYENNLEWFKEKKDVDIENAYKLIQSKGYFILDPNAMLAYSYLVKNLKYTEEDMRKCFGAGFELSKDYSKTPTPFEDYIKSLDKIIVP